MKKRNIIVKIKSLVKPLGVVVFSPDRKQDIGLRRDGRIADDAHDPVL